MADEVVSAVLRFTRDDVVLAHRGRHVGVRCAGGVPEGPPGAPALPWRRFLVVVPPGARPRDLQIRSVERALLAEPVLVEPIQPLHRSQLAPLAPRVPPDPAIYESDHPRPDIPARLVAVRRLGPYTLVDVAVCPVRYVPRTRRLELLTHLELVLAVEAPDDGVEPVRAADERAYASKVAERVRRMVVNPADVHRFGPPAPPYEFPEPPVRRRALVEHVIITNHNLAGSFAPLATWRNQLGLTSRVVLRSDILANQVPDTGGAVFNHASGYYDGGTRDDAEAIRNFIKWAAVHWNTDFVLLGGDTDVIPERHALATLEGKLYASADFQQADSRFPVGGWPQASTEAPGSPATTVVRGAPGAWQCASTDADPWIRLEMRPRRPINHLTLAWGATHATAYRVAVSDDATTWTDVHTTTAGGGGTVEIDFPCVMATFVRLQVTSGTGFALEEVGVFGPTPSSGVVMPGGTATRVYTDYGLRPNPTNDPDHDRLLFFDGPFAGTVVPYDEHADDTVLGWRFIDDLLAPNPAVSTTATMFLEILGPAAYHGHSQVVAVHDLNLIPTDSYYSDVSAYAASTEHDWDANRNLVYGEQYGAGLDGVNGLADVYVGRAPVSAEGDAAHFVDKVIRYERYVDQSDHPLPADFAVSMLLGSQNWEEADATSLDTSAAGKEDIRGAYLDAAPGRYLFTRCYEDRANVPVADQGPDLDTADTGRIVAGVQRPSNAVSLTSHGGPDYLCYLRLQDVRSLTNPPGVWYANACLTNKFDVTPGDCLGEEAILNPHAGAVAYVGNTRFDHTGDNPFELAFWERMLHSPVLGEMFDACQRACDNAWPQYALNLLGDPAMRVWTDRPQDLEIGIRPFELCVDADNAVSVSVDASGPVADAVVVVSQNGAWLARSTTGVNGKAHLTVHPRSTGQVDIAVFGHNMIPALRNRPVVTCSP